MKKARWGTCTPEEWDAAKALANAGHPHLLELQEGHPRRIVVPPAKCTRRHYTWVDLSIFFGIGVFAAQLTRALFMP